MLLQIQRRVLPLVVRAVPQSVRCNAWAMVGRSIFFWLEDRRPAPRPNRVTPGRLPHDPFPHSPSDDVRRQGGLPQGRRRHHRLPGLSSSKVVRHPPVCQRLVRAPRATKLLGCGCADLWAMRRRAMRIGLDRKHTDQLLFRVHVCVLFQSSRGWESWSICTVCERQSCRGHANRRLPPNRPLLRCLSTEACSYWKFFKKKKEKCTKRNNDMIDQ